MIARAPGGVKPRAQAGRVVPTLGKDQILIVNLSGRGDKDCQEVARLVEGK